jgi:hypothetical protein
LPPKHSAPRLRPARVVFAGAAAILLGLVGWVAVRAVGPARDGVRQPTVVLPSMPQIPVGVDFSTSPSYSSPISPPPPSRSPAPSRTSLRSSPTSSPTTRVPSKTAKPTTAPPVTLTAKLSVGASWDGGYVAGVQITNTGTKTVSWSVTVTHSDQNGLRLTATWSAGGAQSGTSFVFTGGPLAPGATANFGYTATKQGQGAARPAGCTVVGGACTVR